ncbi:MAG: hypothetical protein J1E57_02970 [Prevotella sp.]|nr:hypothetical protein [Prevotella sp.]
MQERTSISFNESINYGPLLEGLGIVRFDCGSIQDNNKWIPDKKNSFCLQGEGGLHEKISELFQEKFIQQNPINLLMDYYKDKGYKSINDDFVLKQIDTNILYSICMFPFTGRSVISNNRRIPQNSLCSLEKAEQISSNREKEVCDFFDTFDKIVLPKEKKCNNSKRELFWEYQQIFTDIICSIYNVQYVSVILLLIKQNEHFDFSNFVIIFGSDNTIQDKTKPGHNQLKAILQAILQEKLKKIIRIQKERIQKESIKSAVSAIMSRNMSHNLGSHYLYYTKAHLDVLANKSGEKGPDIRGAAKVLAYMQTRMDYLATIISNDKYPYGSVNFKSQIYDELTIDDFSKRHFNKDEDKPRRTTNFLLSNLILSENFSRSNIFDNIINADGGHMSLKLQTMLWNGNKYELFTGTAINKDEATNGIPTIEQEEKIKNILSGINLALPGGAMSCHAFFNVLENFIRNSAKYCQEDFQEEGLIITIAIRQNSHDKTKLDFILFDNKKNANKVLSNNSKKPKTLIQNINDQLANLCILDKDNGIEKSSKGLKEMLFSTVWMRAYNYPNKTYADIINLIHSKKSGKEKLKLINQYGFKIVPITSKGRIASKNKENANLGLMFTLPEFLPINKLDISNFDSESTQITKSLSIYADIIEFAKRPTKSNSSDRNYVDFFTRTYFSDTFDDTEYNSFLKNTKVLSAADETSLVVFKFKSILNRRFRKEIEMLKRLDENIVLDIDSFQLTFGGDVYEGDSLLDMNRQIYFKRHLNTQNDLSTCKEFAYADTVSGGNFTITLYSLVKQGIDDDGKYKTWKDKLFSLKVKESALTRITLIDERLFNNTVDFGKEREIELELKNIRVLNYNPEKTKSAKSLSEIFEGNSFKDKTNRTHFLSIHLGLIEKIVKSDVVVRKFLKQKESFEERVKIFMEKIAQEFSCEGSDVYISVHSGRGDFSKELEGPLSIYPFISLAAIENSFSNSKFLLSQLFYNTVYIGKGRINKKK